MGTPRRGGGAWEVILEGARATTSTREVLAEVEVIRAVGVVWGMEEMVVEPGAATEMATAVVTEVVVVDTKLLVEEVTEVET